MRSLAGLARAGVVLALLAGCGSMGPRIQTGPKAEHSPDGLNKVDGVSTGTLFMKPDYAFGTYPEFILGKTVVTFEQGARVLDKEETGELTSIFEDVATEVIEETGRKLAAEPGPCVALVNLALVDTEITGKGASGGSASIGAVTLVLEIRDGRTNEPLLRYGQRRKLAGASLAAAFKRFAHRFQNDFQRAIPEPTPGSIMTCEERSGGGAPLPSR